MRCEAGWQAGAAGEENEGGGYVNRIGGETLSLMQQMIGASRRSPPWPDGYFR